MTSSAFALASYGGEAVIRPMLPYSAACATGASSTALTFGGDIGRL
jgi:hypothetical protein